MKAMLAIVLLFVSGGTFAANSVLDLNMLTVEIYKNLPKFNQTLYIKKVHQAIADFEQRYNKPYTFAANSYFDFSLMSEAYGADDGAAQASNTADQTYGAHCVIGGVERSTYQRNCRNYCPTTGRPCNPYGGDGFKCGKIYGPACVKRTPPFANISQDCAWAFSKLSAAEKTVNYAAFKSEVETYFKDICRTGKIGNPEQVACGALA